MLFDHVSDSQFIFVRFSMECPVSRHVAEMVSLALEKDGLVYVSEVLLPVTGALQDTSPVG